MWPVIDALRPSFSYLDEFAEKRGSHAHHEYLDKWLGRLRGRTVFFPYGSWAFTDRFPSGCTILEMHPVITCESPLYRVLSRWIWEFRAAVAVYRRFRGWQGYGTSPGGSDPGPARHAA
jgi:hypothetical protein